MNVVRVEYGPLFIVKAAGFDIEVELGLPSILNNVRNLLFSVKRTDIVWAFLI